MGKMGRPRAELPPELTRRLQKLARRADAADAELRETILQAIADGSRPAAIARALGIERDTLGARVRAWGKIPDPRALKGDGS